MAGFDRTAFLWIVTHRLDVLDGPFWLLGIVGRSGLIWLILGLVFTLLRRLRPRDFLQLAFVLITALVVTDYMLKPLFNRQRPFVTMPTVEVIGSRPSDASFPSGHAATAVAAALTLTRVAPAGAFWWWVLAGGIVCSRIYLGVHYPLDVFGGAFVGLACALLFDAGASRGRHS